MRYINCFNCFMMSTHQSIKICSSLQKFIIFPSLYNLAIPKYQYQISSRQEFHLMSHENHSLGSQCCQYEFLIQKRCSLSIYSTEGIIKQIYITILIKSPGKLHPLFLATTKVYASIPNDGLISM
uniref:Uncharacterized protein n=1 Tax=Opuntia streptacantha TaxID=393608 RepID=A0A7C9AQK0_OPUST